MRKTSRILALMFVAFMILGSTPGQTITSSVDSNQPMGVQLDILSPAAYDSPNITASLVSLTNGSTVSGFFDITLNMTSDFTALNLTLFVDGAIYPDYNETSIVASPSWLEVMNINSTKLSEGMLNFTALFEYNVTQKESVYMLYYVDNDGFDMDVALYIPVNETEVSGIISIDLNITADVDTLNLTVYVDDEIYSTAFIGTGNVSVIVDTSTLIEGYDNFTLFFQYDVLATYFNHSMYLVYLVDNDGLPITIDHLSPANQTQVSGVFNLTLEIGSEYEPLEFTLFIDGIIHEYNKSALGIKHQIVAINTTGFTEGLRNFTLLFYYNVTGEEAQAVYTLVYDVNNHLAPTIIILDPTADSTVTGFVDLWLNISSTHPDLYLNVTVDGVITDEFNRTVIGVGAFNYTFNASRYENGNHIIGITACTGENATTTIETTLVFLDYVRVWIAGLTSFDEISGDEEITIRVEMPFDNATVSFFINGTPVPYLQNVTVYQGTNTFNLNTTLYPEGVHEIMIVAIDDFGHEWETSMILVINNKGAPTIRYATTDSVVIGLAAVTIDVTSAWDELFVTIFVDDEVVSDYENETVDVSSGSFTFYINTDVYSKTEHTVRVVMTTVEGDSSEIERIFGFASLRFEEIISLGVLAGLALIIPLYRKKQGYPIKTVLMVDTVFAIVIVGAFFMLGISTIPFLLWHVNMASIWAIGGILVFTNWALPFVVEDQ